ncbi:MAG: DUF1571 domain-containing protein [Chitinophagales bacterium]|nr:DUF1571 domain-containing protein [Chitinophagales bacterium]
MKKTTLLLVLFISSLTLKAQDAATVINKMISAVSAGKTYEYTLNEVERINGKNIYNTIFTKVQENPKKIYLHNIKGENEGVEVLYVQGERGNKALVNKMFGIKLSPFNSLIRKNNHHTVLESGFGLVLKSIKGAKQRAIQEGRFNEVFQLAGSVTFDGQSCYKIIITDPTFTYVDYTIKSGETLYSISMDKAINEQLIVEKNGFSNFNSGSAGQTIKIPSSYAKKSILYINKSTFFPVYQEMHDDKGMFEKYEFLGLKVNPTFTTVDFSEDNPKYNF